MASKERVQAVAASREMLLAGFFWKSSIVIALALAALLLASSLAQAQEWVRPAPPLVGYVGSSAAPQLCQHTYPLREGCWLGLDPQRAMQQVCALHGDTPAGDAALPAGEKLFTAEVQCATQRVGIAGQPFYCDSSGLIEARYRDAKTGKTAFSCTPPSGVPDPNKSMGYRGHAAEGVNPVIGNAYRGEQDYRNSANPLLEIRRLYNSMDQRPRAFGFNWVGSYERRLEIYPGLRVVAWRPDANLYYFDESRNGKFTADRGVKDALVKVAGGSGVAWRYTNAADRVVEDYDERGVLVGMRTAGGASVRLEYSGGDSGHLLRVIDSAGRAVSFGYDGQGRVSRAIDPTGKVYVYTYGGPSSCRNPGTGAVPCAAENLSAVTAEGGRTVAYRYDEASAAPISLPRALTSVVSDGIVRASWKYDLNGAAVSAGAAATARSGLAARHCAGCAETVAVGSR